MRWAWSAHRNAAAESVSHTIVCRAFLSAAVEDAGDSAAYVMRGGARSSNSYVRDGTPPTTSNPAGTRGLHAYARPVQMRTYSITHINIPKSIQSTRPHAVNVHKVHKCAQVLRTASVVM